ncbi:MAG TPA: hypothetical protein VIG24_02880 [Acidimicrobiia bacterium]
MADMSDFEEARPKPKMVTIDKILDELDDDRADALRAALTDLSYSVPTIVKVLQKWGYKISTYPVAEWRRKNV